MRYLMLIVAPNHEAFWGFSDGMWIQGGFGLCRLPEFALGMVLGVWHQKNPGRAENFLLGGRGLLLSIVAYPFALMLYRNMYGYIFVDLCTGLCCFLLTVGIAGLVGRISWLGQIIAICGTYSYGIYLLHQPHMIFLGLRIRELPPSAFAFVALAGIAAVSLFGIGVEKAVNALMQRIPSGRTAAAAATGGN
jgi:peptidoglycan/LPS O-acetylase OafA/YrhL